MSDATIIEVQLLSGRYHAHVWGESQFGMAGPEWPPSPWRLLRALAAAWFCTHPRASLESNRGRLLETLGRAGSPELWLPRTSFQELRYYQPVRLGASDRVLHHDHFAVPEGGRFCFRFAVGLDDDQCALLDSLLARIRYFGRSESRVLVRRIAADGDVPHGVYRVLARNHAESRPDIIYRRVLGTTIDFRAMHLWSAQDGEQEGTAGGHPPHLVDALLSKKRPLPLGAQWIEYAVPAQALVHEIRPHAPVPEAVAAIQVAEIRFRLSRRIPIPLRQLVAVARAFREAAVHSHRRISPAYHSRTLTGRESDDTVARGNDHAYYLPRLRITEPTIDELVVRIPTTTLTRAEVDAMLSVHRIRTGDGKYAITVVAEKVEPLIDPPTPAKRWRSTTPFLPPLRHRRGRDRTSVEEQAARCAERCCGRRPIRVDRVAGPGTAGSTTSLLAHEYGPNNQNRRGRSWRLTRRAGSWLELTFDEPVTLDVSIGADAHFGAGQFSSVVGSI
jgi:CRISPR-associated protein Csb2